jgi:phage shock protein E
MFTTRHLGSRLILAVAQTIGFALSASAQEHTTDSLATVKGALLAQKAVLIDVREQQEWNQGHLRDAKLLPLSNLKKESSAGREILPKDKAIYLHCRSGGRCLQAAEILRKEGYDVRALKEGYMDLLQAGFPKAEK